MRAETIQTTPLHSTCENQCARCGSSVYFVDCESCDDGYLGSDCIDDLCHGGECIHGDSGQIPCDICRGDGGWWTCCSGAEWCEAHPITGREAVKRGTIEWFCIDLCEAEEFFLHGTVSS